MTGGWSAGMNAGVWEYKTTHNGRVFYDRDEAEQHFYRDLQGVGDLFVRPFGYEEWGLYARGAGG